LRLADILSSVEAILSYTERMSKEEFVKDRKTVDAVIRNFEIVGEASAHIPDAIQAQYPEVPWRDMYDMRNVLAHEYFGVSLNIVWKTIQEELLPLVTQLRSILDTPEQ